jgi:YegS/Rv2252/BmrU family lipid kinase
LRRALVIRNPVAGRGRARRAWPEVERALRAAGVEFDVTASEMPGHACSLAEQGAGQYDAVIAVGGDGTVHEVANGLLHASGGGETIALGIVPLGSGDDFAKMLAADWRDSVRRISAGPTPLMDVGRLRIQPGGVERYFVNGMDIGFGAHGALNAATMPSFLKGFAAYLGALVKTLVDYPMPRVTLQLDDAPPFEQVTTMTAVMNGRSFGGSFRVCPDAQADDGVFDVLIAGALGRLAILRLVPKIMRGTHTGDPRLRMARACRVTIESREPLVVEADGEIPSRDARRIEVEIMPRRLRVFG